MKTIFSPQKFSSKEVYDGTDKEILSLMFFINKYIELILGKFQPDLLRT